MPFWSEILVELLVADCLPDKKHFVHVSWMFHPCCHAFYSASTSVLVCLGFTLERILLKDFKYFIRILVSWPWPVATCRIRGQCTPNVVVPRKISFKHIVKRNIPPLKNVSPQTLNLPTGLCWLTVCTKRSVKKVAGPSSWSLFILTSHVFSKHLRGKG